MDLLTELESLIPELEKGLDQASSLQEMEVSSFSMIRANSLLFALTSIV